MRAFAYSIGWSNRRSRRVGSVRYATENLGGFTLNYVSSSDVATVFQALTTGLRPYSPGAPGIPGHGWPGTASAEVGTFGLAGGSDGQGGSNACGAWGGTPAPSTTQDAAAGSDAGAPTTHDGVSHSPGPGSSGSYGFRGGFLRRRVRPSRRSPFLSAPSLVAAAPESDSGTLALSGLAGLLIFGGSRVRRCDATAKGGDDPDRSN